MVDEIGAMIHISISISIHIFFVNVSYREYSATIYLSHDLSNVLFLFNELMINLFVYYLCCCE